MVIAVYLLVCSETSCINEVPLDVDRESCTPVACNSCKAKWPETERERTTVWIQIPEFLHCKGPCCSHDSRLSPSRLFAAGAFGKAWPSTRWSCRAAQMWKFRTNVSNFKLLRLANSPSTGLQCPASIQICVTGWPGCRTVSQELPSIDWEGPAEYIQVQLLRISWKPFCHAIWASQCLWIPNNWRNPYPVFSCFRCCLNVACNSFSNFVRVRCSEGMARHDQVEAWLQVSCGRLDLGVSAWQFGQATGAGEWLHSDRHNLPSLVHKNWWSTPLHSA